MFPRIIATKPIKYFDNLWHHCSAVFHIQISWQQMYSIKLYAGNLDILSYVVSRTFVHYTPCLLPPYPSSHSLAYPITVQTDGRVFTLPSNQVFIARSA